MVGRIRYGKTQITGTFSGNKTFTARVNFGVNLGTTDYVIATTLLRNGVDRVMHSVKQRYADGLDIYVSQTGDYSREAFEVNWVAIVV